MQCVFLATPAAPHLAQVQDEAVSLVEAAPRQLHLLGSDVAFAFDLVEALHRLGALSRSLPEARVHAAVLVAEQQVTVRLKLCISQI